MDAYFKIIWLCLIFLFSTVFSIGVVFHNLKGF